MDVQDQKVQQLDVNLIQPNPHQPRKHLDQEDLDELMESINIHGVLEPIVLAHTPAGYQIIAGERRWRAAKAAGLPKEGDEELFALLREKDVPGLAAACANLPEPYRSALLALPDLYGDARVLTQAKARLPDLPVVSEALQTLSRLAELLADLPVDFDLSDLRGYHYHTGVVFAAYAPGR